MVDPTADAVLSAAPSDEDAPAIAEDSELVEEELLVEDVSIDGMCGVY
jgi:mycofactocin precursor